MDGAFPYVIGLKQGATLALDLYFTDDNGAPIDLTQAQSLTMLVCDPFGNQVAAPTVTPGSEMGWAIVSTSTAGWPYGELPCQIEVVAQGLTDISHTFPILLLRGVNATS